MAQESSTCVESVPDPVEWKGTDRYEILGRLGQGGMGVVYEAFDRERRHLVALKTLLHSDASALYLFKQEFRTLADVRHTNLVHLFELSIDEGGHAFFTMELVRGGDFLAHVRGAETGETNPPATVLDWRPQPAPGDTLRPKAPRRPSPAPARVSVDPERLRASLRQLVEGVHALHVAGKLHRDIKPSNVLVTHEGRVVLLDFGVATELSSRQGPTPAGSGEVVGTARYMAPEQADDEPPTAASDWYSVGVIVYEALVGRPPFAGSAIDVLTMKSIMDPPLPSESVKDVPPELDALCAALLRRDPTQRPTGQEILRRLGVTRSSAPPAPQISTPELTAGFIGRSAQLATLRESFEVSRGGRSVTVRVGGASGMGKSTVVHHFLDDLTRRGEALVLRGRAYEREAVPYKAIDAVIDALTRHLLVIADAGEAPVLPDDTWLLARLFPVLQRVPSVGDVSTRVVDEPHGMRRRAFAALRELLTTLATRQPLVVFVDDAQWGDVDSATLLLEMVRPPNAPPMLLAMTYRDNEALTSPFLNELRLRWPTGAESRNVVVGPLDNDEAQQLALALLNASDEAAQRTARAVARESRGSPFLVEELVRGNRGVASATGATLAVLTLEQMVGERLARLPQGARRLLEVVAVGGQPLPIAVVAGAAGVDDSANELVSFLSARRFLRTGLRGGGEVVEAIHDRIRETIVAQLSAEALCEHHANLARMLERGPRPDAEAVAIHWFGAGDTARAARFARDAAEDASEKLALDQAARLFRFALDNAQASPDETRRLTVRLAQVLCLAGRYEESARMYAAAAEDAPADERAELQRAAAEQLLTSGHIEEGTEVLHRVLAAVGMTAPRTPLAAVFWLIVYRVWLLFIGLRVKERTRDEVSREDRLRIEALSTVSLGFAVVDVVLGACMQARHLVEALRAGDRFQVVRALGLEAAHLAATGRRETARELELVNLARAIGDREASVEAAAYRAGTRGVGLFNRGRWAEARPLLESADQTMQHGHAGLVNARLFAVYSLFFLGDLREASRKMARLCAVAEDHGDLYTPVSMRTSLGLTLSLAEGDPDGARQGMRNALAQWTQNGFHVQHWQALAYGPDIDVYCGEPGRAYDAFVAGLPLLRKSMLLHSGFIRVMTALVRARLAIASIASHPELRAERVAVARRMARKLSREYDAYAAVFVAFIEALAANADGERTTAIAALRLGIARAEATHTLAYVAPAQHRLGQLLGGDEGQALVRRALETMSAQGIHEPERWMSIFFPGIWKAGAE